MSVARLREGRRIDPGGTERDDNRDDTQRYQDGLGHR
jgi:hypothetical protein